LLRKKYAPRALPSEDYKTRIPTQATVRDVAVILFAKFVSSTSCTFEASKLCLSRQIKIDCTDNSVAVIHDIKHSHADALTG